jgi:hypothetical protein
MKKIILSVAVAAMALSTTASALEDIKVNGQAKLWYETNDVGTGDLLSDRSSSGEVVFKLGMTGKQGNVGFGATVYQTSTMGLENNLVSNDRAATSGAVVATSPATTVALDASGGRMYTGEMYITLPAGEKTLLKIGKQELDTPLAYTEKWNATPNTFNAAVAINSSFDNLTLIGAYVGQGSGSTIGNTGEVVNTFFEGAYAAAALYNNKTIAANVWYYDLKRVATALWIDAGMKLGPVDAKAYYATMMGKGALKDTDAYALSAAGAVAGINLFAAYSDISKTGSLAVGNTATGFKKTKLPTAGVYTDGIYVAQMDSSAFKVKASGKLGTTGLALQYIDNSNKTTRTLETQEVDLIISEKVGDVNLKAILMNRSFDLAATDAALGGNYVRVIASVNF